VTRPFLFMRRGGCARLSATGWTTTKKTYEKTEKTKKKKKVLELHLLRSCLSVCKVTHLLRCVPSSSLGSFPSHFGLRLQECLNRILCCGFSDNSWTQATLLFRLGGLGLHESKHSAAPAFVGFCNSVCILVPRLVASFDVFMRFPGEECTLTFCLFLW